jgi:hypothetical protein
LFSNNGLNDRSIARKWPFYTAVKHHRPQLAEGHERTGASGKADEREGATVAYRLTKSC